LIEVSREPSAISVAEDDKLTHHPMGDVVRHSDLARSTSALGQSRRFTHVCDLLDPTSVGYGINQDRDSVITNINWNSAVFYTEVTAAKGPTPCGWLLAAIKPHEDKEIIKRIEKVLNKGTRAVASGHFDQLAALNQEFHRELYAAGRNTVLGEIVQNLRGKPVRNVPSPQPCPMSDGVFASIIRGITSTPCAANARLHNADKAGATWRIWRCARFWQPVLQS
jgi:hypothetical protein